jgi:hypothetical protein
VYNDLEWCVAEDKLCFRAQYVSLTSEIVCRNREMHEKLLVRRKGETHTTYFEDASQHCYCYTNPLAYVMVASETSH